MIILYQSIPSIPARPNLRYLITPPIRNHHSSSTHMTPSEWWSHKTHSHRCSQYSSRASYLPPPSAAGCSPPARDRNPANATCNRHLPHITHTIETIHIVLSALLHHVLASHPMPLVDAVLVSKGLPIMSAIVNVAFTHLQPSWSSLPLHHLHCLGRKLIPRFRLVVIATHPNHHITRTDVLARHIRPLPSFCSVVINILGVEVCVIVMTQFDIGWLLPNRLNHCQRLLSVLFLRLGVVLGILLRKS